MTEMKHTFEEGREAQFREMIEELALLQSKYKGVRGELLAKVRTELMRLKPSASTAGPRAVVEPPKPPSAARVGSVNGAAKVGSVNGAAKVGTVNGAAKVGTVNGSSKVGPANSARVGTVPPGKILPSCRVCGRGMKLNGSEGSLICQNGHTRIAT